MRRHSAPVPEPDETPENYIVRVVNYLAEPDRRRLGETTRGHLIEAARKLKEGRSS